MMDIGAILPGGLNRPVSGTPPPASSGGTTQTQTVAPARRPDPDAPTGPPPAFATTPLELDSNLDMRLARLKVAGYATVRALEPRETASS